MKKRTAGLSGILALSAAFAVLVSACYNLDYVPPITGVRLDRNELRLSFNPPLLDTHVFTATLLPNNVGWDSVDVEWRIDPEGPVVRLDQDHIDGPSMKISANYPGITTVTVTVTVTVEGRPHPFVASCIVDVRRPD